MWSRADDAVNQAAYPVNQAAYAVACEARGLREGYRARLPVPCKHAALAARRLEREGLARWDEHLGGWSPRHRPPARARAVATIINRSGSSDPAA